MYLDRHLLNIHQVFFDTHFVKNIAIKRGQSTNAQRAFKCETRDKSFLRRKRLKSHEQICQNMQSFIVVLKKSCSEIGPILESKGMRTIFQK